MAGKRKRKTAVKRKSTAADRPPINQTEAIRKTVADFAARGIDSVGDWDAEPDVNGTELWHNYEFQFPAFFSPDDIPALVEIARARLYQFGYRGMTSVRVMGGVGDKQNFFRTGTKTLTYTRHFNAAFSQVDSRLRQLKFRGSIQQVITGIAIFAHAPRWMERQLKRKGKPAKRNKQAKARPSIKRARAASKGHSKKKK